MSGRPRDLVRLPKAHLHCHLEGALRWSTVQELAIRAGVDRPRIAGFSSLPGFLTAAATVNSWLRSPADLTRAARELVVDDARQGVVHLEVTVSPRLFESALGSTRAVVVAVLEGLQAAAPRGMTVGVIWGALCDGAPDEVQSEATAAGELAAAGVVGFGLVGDETLGRVARLRAAFDTAHEAGLSVVPHAGETGSAKAVAECLTVARPHRVAHGVRAAEDPAVLAELASRGVVCDVCPTSNVRLGIVAGLSQHPLPVMLAAGVGVSIGADDPLYFGAGIADEYAACRDVLGLDDSVLAGIARTSLQAAAMPTEARHRALAGVEAWLAS